MDDARMHEETQQLSFVLQRLGVDVAAAATASLGVSPFIAIVDRAIIENASGARRLSDGVKQLSMEFLRHPLRFLHRREFRLVFGLYTATYASANSIETLCDATDTDNQMPKFVGTTAVNMTLCIAKDRAFTQMFGVIAPAAFPLASVGLFAIRDSMTVAASFNAPKIMAQQLQEKAHVKPSTSATISQLVCPAAVQFVSTPLHLVGLDLYNHKGASMSQRLVFVQREYIKSVFARIARIGPAFGIGGVGNTYCRQRLRTALSL
ncbi:hypothetical protein Poli38472_001492 [Pythium oligandrum]|uniref:Uncharacterized protein n=1 Tax=Pythium oligandrum TaxID=41045 RepID=A0A8K1CT18_PYTOL|nr:hypothetical protein Poli38472_001492 [Pythium oligandrum]|eukprot:TMW69336.1 hypothetical protein Poli38472_001492 [Pythium oligandrum]